MQQLRRQRNETTPQIDQRREARNARPTPRLSQALRTFRNWSDANRTRSFPCESRRPLNPHREPGPKRRLLVSRSANLRVASRRISSCAHPLRWFPRPEGGEAPRERARIFRFPSYRQQRQTGCDQSVGKAHKSVPGAQKSSRDHDNKTAAAPETAALSPSPAP